MDSCLKLVPSKCYNTYSSVVLALFVAIGVVLVGITSDYESRSSLECDPNKSFTSTLSKRKYVETQCLLKYGQEFLPSLSLNVLIVISFGLVVILSVVYGYLVKHRVDIFSNNRNAMTSVGGVEESHPLSDHSEVSPDEPVAYPGSGRYFVFMAYIIHLIVCRIIPLTIFSAFLLTSSNFPTHFKCPLPNVKATTSTFHENVTLSTTNSSFVDCTYSIGGGKQQVVVGFITINFLVDAVTLVEIVYLLWSAWKTPTFRTDKEFITVYLLRKRTNPDEQDINCMIRENIFQGVYTMNDGLGGNERKLDEMFINVIIQDGRERVKYSERELMKGRHEIYDIQLEKPPNSKPLNSTTELFQAAEAGKGHPRTVLVVGRPGIGKTILTKKISQEWQQGLQQREIPEFWQEKVVLLIEFRNFNKGETSLQEMLDQAHGLNKAVDLPKARRPYKYICKKPSNTILVFDGLDELQVDDEHLTSGKTVNSLNEPAHIYLIFKQLVKNNELLPGVTVLTTSRPTAERAYQNLNFDRQVEILGFSEKQIEEFVTKFCCNDTQKNSEMWNIIKDSPELISFCYIPVNCQIVCLTLNESIDFGEHEGNDSTRIPKTITELYKRAIKILLLKHNSKNKNKPIDENYLTAELPKQLQEDLNKLKRIAMNGMENDQLIFDRSSDKSLAGLSDSGVFNKLKSSAGSQVIFSFLHLTIQEFLAALHVVDDLENVKGFLEEHIAKPRWHLVIQFVAGLLGDRMRELSSTENEDSEQINNPKWYQPIHWLFGGSRSKRLTDTEIIEIICER
ncbi:NACHT, LRR and PYD domains-containing protein 3-like [Dendronephthya gigantea]|uniref:NACHT, LRR and PYD domains-containing protein 3-like n=1 Tax=Dendronephthya gigantea TaxID=151771 RepID=UPI00106911B6|nr:NACHT, LRR and PYD domains-containing protein 3-like [Dendronephthya gigantea]